ncbi:MAG: hypothetical protein HY676_01510 [Chloroflexi bacterium]|nr:hypothetical protein [Chloroflexota bacterium]
MTSGAELDQGWGLLADETEEQREKQMLERYGKVAALSEDERRSRLLAMAKAEYALSDAKLRSFTMSRLRVWLKMELEIAKKVADSYDAVMFLMPGPAAMRRVAIVQTLARGFSSKEQEQLRTLIPRVFADRPIGSAVAPGPAAAPGPSIKKPWWAFWKRS